MGCREIFRKKPGFWGLAIGFFVDGRSGFGWMGDRIFGGWAIGFLGGWAIEFDLLVRSLVGAVGASWFVAESARGLNPCLIAKVLFQRTEELVDVYWFGANLQSVLTDFSY